MISSARGDKKAVIDRALPCAVSLVRDPMTAHLEILLRFPTRTLSKWILCPGVPDGPRRRAGGTPNKMDPRDSKGAGEWCRAASFSGGGDGLAERNGPGAGDQPNSEGAG